MGRGRGRGSHAALGVLSVSEAMSGMERGDCAGSRSWQLVSMAECRAKESFVYFCERF